MEWSTQLSVQEYWEFPAFPCDYLSLLCAVVFLCSELCRMLFSSGGTAAVLLCLALYCHYEPMAQDLNTSTCVHEWQACTAIRNYFLKNSWLAFYVFFKFHSNSSLSKISFVFIQKILTRLNFRNIGLVFVILHVTVASSCIKCPLIFFSWPFQILANYLKGHNRVFHLIVKYCKPQLCIIASTKTCYSVEWQVTM